MSRIFRYSFTLLCLSCLVSTCKADQLFYTGPESYQLGVASDGATGNAGFGNTQPYAVTASFALSEASTINQVSLSIWTNIGYQPVSLDWAITTSMLGTGVVAQGSVAPGTFNNTNPHNVVLPGGIDPTVWWSSFSVPNVQLDAGTYYLFVTNGDPGMSWGLAQTPAAQSYQLINLNAGIGLNPDWALARAWNTTAFEIDGTTAVPEPSSLVLFGSGLLLGSAILQKRFSRLAG